MTRVLCIITVKEEYKERFLMGVTYNIKEIVDNGDNIELMAINHGGVEQRIGCLEGDIETVGDADWYKDTFFKKHFRVIKGMTTGVKKF